MHEEILFAIRRRLGDRNRLRKFTSSYTIKENVRDVEAHHTPLL
jgi:hypothetical protein